MRRHVFVGLAVLALSACSDDTQEPDDDVGSQANGDDASIQGDDVDVQPDTASLPDAEEDPSGPKLTVLRAELRDWLDERELEPLSSPPATDAALVELGHNLFFDPILSGAKDTNCAFCHQMDEATTDAFPLSAGTGAIVDENGDRRPGPQLSFTNRTSTELFNRGHQELRTMFWDRRLEQLDDGRFVVHDTSYPKLEGVYWRVLPEELDNLLAAQAMLPVHSRDEMRGINGTYDIFGNYNEVAAGPAHNPNGSWNRLMDRLAGVSEYRAMFEEAYPDKHFDELSFAHVANALAAFQIDAFSFSHSPWDSFVAGDDDALSDAQIRGAHLFYGDAGCARCHGGQLFTDQELYNWAVPPMTRGPESFDNMDLGAAHRSHAGSDKKFHFRTPPLRNVELTGPYMHNGSYETLQDVIRHKIDPIQGLWNYDSSHMGPVFRQQVHTDATALERVESTVSAQALLTPSMSDEEIDDIVAFLEALTSPDARDLSHLDLDEVPSGLPVPDPTDLQ